MKLRCTKVCASVARTFFLGAKSIGGGEDAATAMATMTIGSSFPLEGCMDGDMVRDVLMVRGEGVIYRGMNERMMEG